MKLRTVSGKTGEAQEPDLIDWTFDYDGNSA